MCACVTLGDGLVVRQSFERAIEAAGALECAHEARLLVEHRLAEELGQ